MPKDMDKDARLRIARDINTNFFVEAGAGSGKTTVLVDRMVSMVENGIDISKICAITFTKAAAAEFYARFQKKLSESASQRAEKALKNIDLCFMGTIDAFCNMVLSEHPASAGIPSDAAIITEDEETALYTDVYSRILRGELGDSALYDKAKKFSENFYNAKDLFAEGARHILASRDADFVYAAPYSGTADSAFASEKKRILEVLGHLCMNPGIMPETEKKATDAKHYLINVFDSLKEDWEGNLGIISSKFRSIEPLRISAEYEPHMNNFGPGWEHFFIPHTTKSGKIQWYEVNKEDDPFIIKKLNNSMMSIALDFIKPAAFIASEELKKQGKLTFSDYLYYLRDMLREDATNGGNLIRHIYKRHSYFLSDESQDNNPVQVQLLFYLTAQNPDPDWTKCVPKPGSLFIVGDPKQSIYRFRQADVSSYIRVKDLFTNPAVGEVLHLTRNFRSTDTLCEWFNDVFSRLLATNTPTQSKFDVIPTGEKQPYKGTLNGVYTYVVKNARSNDEAEDPFRVAEIIRRIVDDPGCTIQDPDEKGVARLPRRPEYRDFMVITASKTHLTAYLKEMMKYGIPYSVEGKALFGECPALISICRIMSALADPFDKEAVFAAQYISGCGMDGNKIRDLVKEASSKSPASIFSMLLEDEKVFARAGAANAEYVYFALELLRSAQTDGSVTSMKEAAAFLRDLIDDNSKEERCIQLCRDSNRVRLANLHKVKGLEAPIVILADPKAREKRPSARVDYSSSPAKGYIFKLGDSITTTDFDKEKGKESEAISEENIRLLYVAATRAGCALIVADGIDSKENHLSHNPWFLLFPNAGEPIKDHIDKGIQAVPVLKKEGNAENQYNAAEKSSVFTDRTSETASYQIRRPSSITLKGVSASEDDAEDKAETEILKSGKKENPALVGTMVHRFMEYLVSTRKTPDTDTLITEILREYAADDSYYRNLLQGVADVILSGGYEQKGAAPKDILAELLSADELYCELPFCHKENGEIWHGVMDVVYRKDGRWHIVDYKTNADGSDLDQHYKDQLAAYVDALKSVTGEDADALIYHIAV